jgi:hypothetical protein
VSFQAMAILLGREWHHTAWASLAHSVRTGESSFLKVYGMPHFELFQANAEQGAIFKKTMSLTEVAADASRRRVLVVEMVVPPTECDRESVSSGTAAELMAVMSGLCLIAKSLNLASSTSITIGPEL